MPETPDKQKRPAPELLAKFAKLPPKEAIQFLEAKGLKPSWRWEEVWNDSHAKAFTVAKATQLDVLKDIKGALEDAMSKGLTAKEFEKQLTPLLQAKGWWGKKDQANPVTGEMETVQLGSPWRLKTIYQTNMQSSMMAGRYAKMMQHTDSRPYLIYLAILDGRTRAGHRALHRRIFRYDDPFWSAFYAPNGHGCRCRVDSVGEYELDDYPGGVESSEGLMGEREMVISRATGEVRKVTTFKAGDLIVHPDPGFDHNPGKNSGLWDMRGNLPDGMPGAKGKNILSPLPEQKTWKDYARPDLRQVPPEQHLPAPALLKAGADATEATKIMAQALGLGKEKMRYLQTPVEQVLLREELLAHIVEKRAEARERFANFILPTLEDPYEIYLTEYPDGFRARYIGLFAGKYSLMSVVRINPDGSLFYNLMHAEPKKMNGHRVGLLYHVREPLDKK